LRRKIFNLFKLTGEELGEYTDINELRQKAVDYYRNNISGQEINHPIIGKINFFNTSIKKYKNASANPLKLKLMPKLLDIVKTSEYINTSSNYKNRKDGITKFHYLQTQIFIGDEIFNGKIKIGADKFGNKFYDIEESPLDTCNEQTLGTNELNNNYNL